MSHSHRRPALLVAAAGLPIGLVVAVVLGLLGVPWPVAVGLGAAAVLLAAVAVRLVAWRLLLALIGADTVDDTAEQQLENLLENLCISHGMAMPAIRFLDSPSANALVVARNSHRAAVVVTSGAVQQLRRIEMEGVLAHLLSRVRNGDAAFETLTAAVVALPLRPLGGLQGRIMCRVLPAYRGLRADADAVAMTRYPPGLHTALTVLAQQPHAAPARPAAVRHMWIHEIDWGIRDLSRHPLHDERIAVMAEY